jgi:hypothetical protein
MSALAFLLEGMQAADQIKPSPAMLPDGALFTFVLCWAISYQVRPACQQLFGVTHKELK